MVDFQLDRDGIRQILKSREIASVVNDLANDVARQVESYGQKVNHGQEDIPVVVDEYTTDRRAASVTLAHPAGVAVQAKHGLLTKAAAAVGLEVRDR